MRGTLLIARLTWLETRRRKIALAALICGLLFLSVYGAAMYFGFRLAREGGPLGDSPPDAVGMRVAATILTVAGLYVVNFLVNAVAILLPIDSLSGEIGSGVIQTLASKPVDRAAIVVGKWLAYLLMTAAYLALMAGGVVLIMRLFADYTAPAVGGTTVTVRSDDSPVKRAQELIPAVNKALNEITREANASAETWSAWWSKNKATFKPLK